MCVRQVYFVVSCNCCRIIITIFIDVVGGRKSKRKGDASVMLYIFVVTVWCSHTVVIMWCWNSAVLVWCCHTVVLIYCGGIVWWCYYCGGRVCVVLLCCTKSGSKEVAWLPKYCYLCPNFHRRRAFYWFSLLPLLLLLLLLLH